MRPLQDTFVDHFPQLRDAFVRWLEAERTARFLRVIGGPDALRASRRARDLLEVYLRAMEAEVRKIMRAPVTKSTGALGPSPLPSSAASPAADR